MKKIILTCLLLSLALVGMAVPTFAESNDMVKSNYEKDTRYINNYSYDSINHNINNGTYNKLYSNSNILNNVTNLGNSNFNYLYSAFTVTLNPDINNSKINSSDFELYEHPGLSTSTNTGVIDESFPVFIGFNSTYYVSDVNMYNNNPNIAFIDFNNTGEALSAFSTQSGIAKIWNIFSSIYNGVIGGNLNSTAIVSVPFSTLYNLGYRRYDTKWSNDIGGYAYMVAKFKNLDYSDYEGSLSLSGIQASSYFYKFDFIDPRFNNSYYNNQQVSYYKLTLQRSNFNTSADFTTLMVYDKSNVFIESRTADTINLVIFPNSDNYSITFFRYLNFYQDDNNSTLGNISVTAYYDDSYSISNSNDYTTQLNTINSNLVLIKDLMSDLQINEINNVYNDIQNNYNIDIDLTIQDLIHDIQLNIGNISTNDNLTTDTKTELNTLSQNLIKPLFDEINNSNLQILYILPLAAGVILILL